MMIEFCGLPGVGKSTLARTLEAHGIEKVRVCGKGDLMLTNLRYLCTYPISFGKLFFAIVKTSLSHGRFYPLFMNVFLDTNARIWKAKHSSRPSIVDQGNLQGLLSLSYDPFTQKEVEAFLAHLPKPDLVCVLEVDEAVRMNRLEARGYGPREQEKGKEAWLQNLHRNMETLSKSLREINWAPVEVIKMDEEPHRLAEKILSIVKRLT